MTIHPKLLCSNHQFQQKPRSTALGNKGNDCLTYLRSAGVGLALGLFQASTTLFRFFFSVSQLCCPPRCLLGQLPPRGRKDDLLPQMVTLWGPQELLTIRQGVEMKKFDNYTLTNESIPGARISSTNECNSHPFIHLTISIHGCVLGTAWQQRHPQRHRADRPGSNMRPALWWKRGQPYSNHSEWVLQREADSVTRKSKDCWVINNRDTPSPQ